MDNYFTSFHLLTHLVVITTFEQQVCSTKIDYANALSLGERAAKKNVVIFNSAHQAKKQCNFDSVWLEQQQVAYEHICKKVYAIQEQQLNQLQCYNQSMGFVARIDHNVAK